MARIKSELTNIDGLGGISQPFLREVQRHGWEPIPDHPGKGDTTLMHKTEGFKVWGPLPPPRPSTSQERKLGSSFPPPPTPPLAPPRQLPVEYLFTRDPVLSSFRDWKAETESLCLLRRQDLSAPRSEMMANAHRATPVFHALKFIKSL